MLIAFIQFILLTHSCSVQNCDFCSPANPNLCLNCNIGYTRDLNLGCKQSLFPIPSLWRIENCLELQNSTCIKCQEGYSLIIGHCEPICLFSDCICFYPNTCIHEKRLLTCDNTICAKCDDSLENCLACKDGFGLNDLNNCVKCLDTKCSKCTYNYKICQECIPGTYLNNSNCIYCGSINCASCDNLTNNCIYCNEGLVFDSEGYCCDPSCLTCSYNDWACNTCKQGTFYDGLCYKCIDNCKLCIDNNSCYQCNEGYEQNYKGQCVVKKCYTANCLECSTSINICSECEEEYVLDSLNHCCYPSCKTCNFDSPNCLSCNDGMYLDELICKICPDECLSCTNVDYCLSCAVGFINNSGKCEKIRDKESPFKLPAIFSVVTIFVIGLIGMFIWLKIDKKRINIQFENEMIKQANEEIKNIHEVVKEKFEPSKENAIKKESIEPVKIDDLDNKYYVYDGQNPHNSSQVKNSKRDPKEVKNISSVFSKIKVPNIETAFPPFNSHLTPNSEDTVLLNSYADYLKQRGKIIEVFKPVYENSEFISSQNFESNVPVVQLNLKNSYNGFKVCIICQEKLAGDNDVRALPCKHPYHGKCIFNEMIIENKKKCLYCLKSYA
ncbi:hypothetical protein SteCoe_5208 [Stentor coeruleus]|uniref:RING-type domain-containing protein n=1 Tax=Stentor coeruleus TaxID=5963 RepID=A0A1R2CSW8_9CILI|nr:hypothetical protein SteCoe_5208 [Stentor coeruleus]